MTYRTDDHLESGLTATLQVLDDKDVFPQRVLATLRKISFWHVLVALLGKMHNNTHSYHVPLSERWTLLVAVDALCVLCAIFGTNFFWNLDQNYSQDLRYWLPIMLISWWVFAYFSDLYDIPSSCDRLASAMRVVESGLLGLVVYFGVSLLFVNALPSRFLLYFLAIAMLLIIAWRLVYARLSRFLFSPHRVLILGFEEHGQSIAQLLGPVAHLNYEILGFVDDSPSVTKPQWTDLPLLGRVADVSRLVQLFHVHEVVVAKRQAPTVELTELLLTCQGQGVQVSGMADLYEKFRRSIPIRHIDPSWVLYAIQGQPIFNRLQLVGKRCLDLLLIILILPMLLLLIPFIALLIRLDSPGPIFYRQIRVGRGYEPFMIFKFRTMVPNAEKEGTPQWAVKNDPRITRVGMLLRKTRLDELPQVFNILRGEMSFVGPRPERPEFVEQLAQIIPFYRTRLLVKPGLTGWAQIHYGYGANEDDALIKLEFDFYYVRHWSLLKDIYILFQTVAVVLLCKGT